MDENLDIRFNKAVEQAAKMTQADLPQDVQLRLYAYYKQATFGTPGLADGSNYDLRNAFKTNAWMQISHLSPEQAKEHYIETIEKLLNQS